MEWQFIITDNTSGTPVVTQLANEPQGWADLNIKLKRDPKIHGVFADYSINTLKYTGDGYIVLKNAYDTFGINADVSLEIKWACGGSFESLYQGKFLFDLYKETSGTICSCEVGLMNIGCLNTFTSRLDQKVDLDTNKDFAGNTLPAYDGLGKTIDLPSKGIVLTNWRNEVEDTESEIFCNTVNNQIPAFGATVDYQGFLSLDFSNTLVDELPSWNGGIAWNTNESLVDALFFADEAGDYVVEYNLDLIVGASFDTNQLPTSGVDMYGFAEIRYSRTGSAAVVETTNSATRHVVSIDCSDQTAFDTRALKIPVSYSGTINLNGMAAYDTFKLYLKIFEQQQFDGNGSAADVTWGKNVTVKAGSYIKVTKISYTDPTPCKVYMINESFARITESISEGCMTVYSDYFGRTDAEPYTSDEDGCGALESITKGLLIRRATLQGNEPVMAVSFKDLFDAFCAIHNLGYGIEDDTNTGGKMIRIEPMEYFFPSTVIFSADKIPMVDFSNNTAKQYGKFNFGYEKFEAEEFNGLDEFLSKREYRSPLNSKNILEQVCKFISSGYSIEVTRRKGNTDTKDWRLDNDYFVICLKRLYTDVVVEQGGITDDVNIIDPDTIYNFRISPMRNAMRWMKYILGMFAIPLDSTKSYLQFTDGTGNYFAEGKLTTGCILEAAALAENGDLSIDLFDDIAQGIPVWASKQPKFTYPLSRESFKAILANPTGVVEYECAGLIRQGYISELDYKPASGDATFTLIPKYS